MVDTGKRELLARSTFSLYKFKPTQVWVFKQSLTLSQQWDSNRCLQRTGQARYVYATITAALTVALLVDEKAFNVRTSAALKANTLTTTSPNTLHHPKEDICDLKPRQFALLFVAIMHDYRAWQVTSTTLIGLTGPGWKAELLSKMFPNHPDIFSRTIAA